MERYERIKVLGSGSFSTVTRAKDKKTGETVAVKKSKKRYNTWRECSSLREIKSLRKMNHPNIMKLNDLVFENNELFLVFEYVDFNLCSLMEGKRLPFPESQVKKWCTEILLGLAPMHEKGYFHSDLKPENLLVTDEFKIKIADLGQAREIDSSPPYTDYVATRWYRAPEMLLNLGMYGPEVDMWALGAIVFELLSLRPMFRGVREADQLRKICDVLGTPTWRDWVRRASEIGYEFPKCEGVDFSSLLPFASDDAISLITSLCSWDPSKRPTVEEALGHPFLKSCYDVDDDDDDPRVVVCDKKSTSDDDDDETRRVIEMLGKQERCGNAASCDENWLGKIDWSFKESSFRLPEPNSVRRWFRYEFQFDCITSFVIKLVFTYLSAFYLRFH